ncbi:conserved hypothetical protein [Culex quinquefasciatus]|uniref:Uncharacterized protein n=1 Tax=Culex quinquefasciatus TaxID=7176 RepID=B0W3H1_CULQU|nr:uncharacterized protein LOC6032697 [Culex quinquefasciatus]EDS31314.1 conserved hypothetical protein [Culex quinquefasciatus]|eukprot:XP_001843255.1 conserved hypothetical protein [Culex quinquefasciatus]
MPSANKDKMFGPWSRSDSSGSMYLSNNNNADNLVKLYARTAPTSPRWTPVASRHNSPPMPSSPLSSSPPSTLRRNYSSTFMLIPEDRAVDQVSVEPAVSVQPSRSSATKYRISNCRIILRLILWWPLLLIAIAQRCLAFLMHLSWRPFLIAAPAFWLSACLWMFWKIVALPLACLKWVLVALHTPAHERNRKKRTVLISCGSTIQALHLARNFYKSGARVVVFEFEGLFGLARFSTAVSKFYTIQRPTPETANEYIAALCEIVEKEQPTHYIPVCATSAAYYDSLAKPHLELRGCSSFIPGTQETSVLDDILMVMKKCELNQIALPPHQVIASKEELHRLYDNGWLSGYRNVMLSSGLLGILERAKYVLPSNRRDLKLNYEISESHKWVVIRDVIGTHFVTCTTVKDSQVVANVTCVIQNDTRSLIPEENAEIEVWLKEFFRKIRLQRPLNGHISFRLARCKSSGEILPLGIRVGVSLPYICYTGVHSRVICKPCPHFNRQNSGPLVQDGGRYWMHETVMNTIRRPSVEAVQQLIGTVIDKREALFVYWDPLPYCAYYHFQLPFNSVKSFLHKRQRRTARTMPRAAAPVH